MSDRTLLADVMRSLVAQGKVEASDVDHVRDYLAARASHIPDGFLVRLFQGASAWVTSFFLLCFLFAIGVLNETAASLLLWGTICFLGACFFSRRSRSGSVTHEQFVVAFALVADGLVLMGLLMLFDDSFELSTLLLSVKIQAAITFVYYIVFRERTLRFLVGLSACVLLGIWCFWGGGNNWILVLASVGCGLVLLLAPFIPNRFDIRAPLELTAAVVAFGILVSSLYFSDIMPLVPYRCLWTGLLVVALVAKARVRHKQAWYIGAAAALVLGIFAHPGIMAALFLLFLAYDRADTFFTVLGLSFLPLFIIFYYYQLNLNLSTKAAVLMASGALLLVVRWAILRVGESKEQTTQNGGAS